MVRVTVANNLVRKDMIVDRSRTLKSVLQEAEIDYTRTPFNLDGAPLQAGQLDRTFDELGVGEACFLLAVVKADNAR